MIRRRRSLEILSAIIFSSSQVLEPEVLSTMAQNGFQKNGLDASIYTPSISRQNLSRDIFFKTIFRVFSLVGVLLFNAQDCRRHPRYCAPPSLVGALYRFHTSIATLSYDRSRLRRTAICRSIGHILYTYTSTFDILLYVRAI